jgi:hypothetical protein
MPSMEDLTGFVGEVADTQLVGVEMDLQIGQMTLRSKHLAALDAQVASMRDVKAIFGDSTIQASLIERASHRCIYRLVGLQHEVHHWSTPQSGRRRPDRLGLPQYQKG